MPKWKPEATLMTLRILPLAAVTVLIALVSGAAAEPDDPAQAIAQKFYEASQPKTEISAKTVAPSASLVKPAQAAKPSQESGSGLFLKATNVVEPATLDADYENEMLAQARAEQIEWQKAYSVSEQTAARVIPVTAVPETGQRSPPVATAPAPVVVQSQPQQPNSATAPEAESARPAPVAQSQAAGSNGEPRATVLVVLDDLAKVPGVRPDPIICFDQQCWISNGLEDAAKPMARSTALALKTTATPTGDSCSGKSACAFRNVPIAVDTPIELVEVGESRGVGQGGYTIAADETCRKDSNELVCSNPLVTHTFRMWVVPEDTAKTAGPELLETAIADDLPDGDAISDDGK